MKRLFLSFLIFNFATFLIGQSSTPKSKNIHLPQRVYNAPPPAGIVSILDEIKNSEKIVSSNEESAEFILIGSSENAFSLYGPQRTILWADPRTEALVFTVAEEEEIKYYLSADNGKTWSSAIAVYTADTANNPVPGFAQGGIINLPGNYDPENAHYTYLSPTYDGSNGTLGGYVYGSGQLTDTVPMTASQTHLTSQQDYYRTIPVAFTIDHQGTAWYADLSQKFEDGNMKYTGKLILGKGTLNESNEIEYTEKQINFLDSSWMFNDYKIEFASDGQTGYFMALAYSITNNAPYSIFHHVFLKTEDGGESWSEPIHIQLGGADGIEAVKEYFSDSAIYNAGYDINVDRDEVYYMMGFNFDLITDLYGNPYLTGVVAIADETGWYPYDGQMATWNLFSTDKGETWEADALYDNIHLTGTVGSLELDNRPYVSASFGGDCIFFSWLDSDIDQAEENNRPNIYLLGYNTVNGWYSQINNATYFTQAWNRAFFGSQAKWIFSNGEYYGCEFPFVFIDFAEPGVETPVNYWYINDFNDLYPGSCECDGPTAINETIGKSTFMEVSQNFPNPASTTTEILVNNHSGLPLQLKVFDVSGKRVFSESRTTNASIHVFHLDVFHYSSGIYFYKVSNGKTEVTRKLVVN